MADYPDTPLIETRGRFRVAREDLVPGGTKERALMRWLPHVPDDVLVYATPAQGFAQVAVARACRALGKRAVLFVAGRRVDHPRTAAARAAGGEIHPVTDCFMLNVVQARAREWALRHHAALLPFGLGCAAFEHAMVHVLRSSGEWPSEFWCAAGSGTLARAACAAWPEAAVHAVCVGTKKVDPGRAVRHWYDRPFGEPSRVIPPFPSVREYDAKAWEVMQESAAAGALFWNVAADPTHDPDDWSVTDRGRPK